MAPFDVRMVRALRKREWLLETIERQRALSPATALIERRRGLTRQEFLDRNYAASRPVILIDEMATWPALKRWSETVAARPAIKAAG